MSNKNIQKKVKEMRNLNKKLKELDSCCKYEIKDLEKSGCSISKEVKNTLNEMIFVPNNYTSYNLLKSNVQSILDKIPDSNKKFYSVNEKIYIELLKIISCYINDKNKEYMFDTPISNGNDIFDCLFSIEEISECYIDDNKGNINLMFDILKFNDTELKIKSTLILLNSISGIEADLLIYRFVTMLYHTKNSIKLEQIHKLLLNFRYNYNEKTNSYLHDFLDYIELDKGKEYDNNLNIIIDKLGNSNIINKIDENNNIVKILLEINLNNFGNKNMEVILDLLNDSFIFTKNTDLRNLIIETTLNMKFVSDEHKTLYLKIINNLILSSDVINEYQIKILYMLVNVKSMKSLELILDLYPFIDKYTDLKDRYDVVKDISKLSDNGNVKKLTIPINYKTDEEK